MALLVNRYPNLLNAHCEALLKVMQARQLGEELRSTAAYQAPEIVIVSPLTRALETAAGVYGIARWTADSTTKPLMLPQAESQVGWVLCKVALVSDIAL